MIPSRLLRRLCRQHPVLRQLRSILRTELRPVLQTTTVSHVGRGQLRSALAGALSTAVVNSKRARSLTLLLRERSRKNKMATLNEQIVLTAILGDISDDSDMNFI